MTARSPECHLRKDRHAGRITLNRPEALNALTHSMCLTIHRSLLDWRDDPTVHLVVIDAEGDKAFCAGGDVVDIYEAGRAGDFAFARQFWRDEYRLNALIATYPKPFVAFMQGYTMGGGVGISCHGSHRIVCESSQIALPEVTIGLIPDIGSTALLGAAPGHLGEYIGTTASRMGPGCAIHAGFADSYILRDVWPRVIDQLGASGSVDCLEGHARPAPASPLTQHHMEIDALFSAQDYGSLLHNLAASPSPFSAEALAQVKRASPLAIACALDLIRAARRSPSITEALEREFRFTSRASENGDFLEGIRAAIIDKDRTPKWMHDGPSGALTSHAAFMISPLSRDLEFLIGDLE